MKGWKLFLVECLSLFCLPASVWAETVVRTDTLPASIVGLPETEKVRHPHDRIVNFGAKGGFTASLFLVSKRCRTTIK